MKKRVLFTLGSGVGWFIGVSVSVAILFSNNLLASLDFGDAFGNSLVLAFPGFILLLIALIFAIRDRTGASLTQDF